MGVIPFDSEPVSDILAGQSGRALQTSATGSAEADEAHASDRVAADQLRTEGAGQERRHVLRVDPVVDEQPGLDDAVDVPGDYEAESPVLRADTPQSVAAMMDHDLLRADSRQKSSDADRQPIRQQRVQNPVRNPALGYQPSGSQHAEMT
jgi:hypothetical protein